MAIIRIIYSIALCTTQSFVHGAHYPLLYHNVMSKQYLPDDTNELTANDTTTTKHSQNTIIPKRRRKKGLILFLALGVFIASSFIYIQAAASPLSSGLSSLPWLKSISQVLTPEKDLLVGEKADMINILLVGMGGDNWEGGYLADTIIIAKFKPSTEQVALVSIPRDFAVNLEGYGWLKINNAYAYGGPELMMQTVSEVLNEPVAYYVTIDFNGFEDLVDDLGGIDVFVERSFTDYQFPNDEFGFQTVSFTTGEQHMDGATALKFSRSRHSPDNGEGSDFARSARQQKVLFAIKDKVLSYNTLLSPTKLLSLYTNITQYVETNIATDEVVRFAQLGQNVRQSNVAKLVLIDGPQGVLQSTIDPVTGAYLLVPQAGFGNFTVIRQTINDLFIIEEPVIAPGEGAVDATTDTPRSDTKQALQEPEPVNILDDGEIFVAVLNGTTIPGYAAAVATDITKLRMEIVATANNTDQNLKKTILYDRNQNKNAESYNQLKNLIDFKYEDETPQAVIDYVVSLDEDAALADYIIILGSDNQALAQ